ncbi:MAG TPA: hypothetical protein H9697_06920, partial [Candidatus Mediterraneibacter faecavium]|nr:hypothetical protein [Candidatus Mediterraneibacter faecavium]
FDLANLIIPKIRCYFYVKAPIKCIFYQINQASARIILVGKLSYEHMMKQLKMYEDIEVSERQIKEGKVKDARESLLSIRKRYGI